MSGWDSWGAAPAPGVEAVTTAPGWDNNTPHIHKSQSEPLHVQSSIPAPVPVQTQQLQPQQETMMQPEKQNNAVPNGTAGGWGAPHPATSLPSSGPVSPVATMTSAPQASSFGNGGDSGWASEFTLSTCSVWRGRLTDSTTLLLGSSLDNLLYLTYRVKQPASPLTSVSRNFPPPSNGSDGYSNNGGGYNSGPGNGYATSNAGGGGGGGGGGYSPQNGLDSDRPRPPRTEADVIISPPPLLKGHIIGPARANLNEIQDQSGAKIFLVLRPDAQDPIKDKEIGIAGSEGQVDEAVKLIVLKARERANGWVPDGKAGEIIQRLESQGKMQASVGAGAARGGYGGNGENYGNNGYGNNGGPAGGPEMTNNNFNSGRNNGYNTQTQNPVAPSTGGWGAPAPPQSTVGRTSPPPAENQNERPITYREAVPMPPPSFIGSSVSQRGARAGSGVSHAPPHPPPNAPSQGGPLLSAQANGFAPVHQAQSSVTPTLTANNAVRPITPPANTVGWGDPEEPVAALAKQNGNDWNGWDSNAPPPPKVENNFPTSTGSTVGSRVGGGGAPASNGLSRMPEQNHSRHASETFDYQAASGGASYVGPAQQASVEVSNAFQTQNRGFETAQPAHAPSTPSGPPPPTGWISGPVTTSSPNAGPTSHDLRDHGRNQTQDSGFMESTQRNETVPSGHGWNASPTSPNQTKSFASPARPNGFSTTAPWQMLQSNSSGNSNAGSSIRPYKGDDFPSANLPIPAPDSTRNPLVRGGVDEVTERMAATSIRDESRPPPAVNGWGPLASSHALNNTQQQAPPEQRNEVAPPSVGGGWGAPAPASTSNYNQNSAPPPHREDPAPPAVGGGWGAPASTPGPASLPVNPYQQPQASAPSAPAPVASGGGWGAPVTESIAPPATSNGWGAPPSAAPPQQQSVQQRAPPPSSNNGNTNGWGAPASAPISASVAPQNGGGGGGGWNSTGSGGGQPQPHQQQPQSSHGWNQPAPTQQNTQNGYAPSTGGGYGNSNGGGSQYGGPAPSQNGGYGNSSMNNGSGGGGGYGQSRPSNGFSNGFSSGGGGGYGGYGGGGPATGCNSVPIRNNRWGKPPAPERQQQQQQGNGQNGQNGQNGYGTGYGQAQAQQNGYGQGQQGGGW